MKIAFSKIAAGLRGAIAAARSEAKPARVAVYSSCDHCGNVTQTVGGRCNLCRGRKPRAEPDAE